MKKFSYQMQHILNIKSKIEEQEKNNFSIAMKQRNEEIEKLLTLEQRKEGYEDNLREAMTSCLVISQIRRLEEAIEMMKQLIIAQKQAVKKAEQAVDLARAKLEFARKERKMHELLREKAFEEYKKEFDEAEKKEIDELVSYQHSIKGER